MEIEETEHQIKCTKVHFSIEFCFAVEMFQLKDETKSPCMSLYIQSPEFFALQPCALHIADC